MGARPVSGLTRGCDPGLRLPVPMHSGGVQTLYLVYRCGGSVGIAGQLSATLTDFPFHPSGERLRDTLALWNSSRTTLGEPARVRGKKETAHALHRGVSR
jgi:hypothetical protein